MRAAARTLTTHAHRAQKQIAKLPSLQRSVEVGRLACGGPPKLSTGPCFPPGRHSGRHLLSCHWARSLASRGHPMPETEPLEIQTEPLTPRRELADRKRCPSSPGSPGSRPAVVLGSRARRASHELVVAQEACDDDAREPPLLPPPSRMEQARDDLLRFMERPCWARLVGRTGLEPQTTRPQAGLLLTRVSLASDRRSCTCSGSSATAPCSSSY